MSPVRHQRPQCATTAAMESAQSLTVLKACARRNEYVGTVPVTVTRAEKTTRSRDTWDDE